MKLLITGCDGFIGAVTTAMAIERGHEVTGVDDRRAGIHAVPGATRVRRDVGDILTAAVGPFDCVLHLAAVPGILDCEYDPTGSFFANVAGTAAIVKFCKEQNTKLVFASTSALYGDPQYFPIDEKHPLNPVGVYGTQKLWCERLIEWELRRWVSFRFFNVVGSYAGYGERSDVDHILPRLFNAAKRGNPFVVNGNDYKTRDGTCLRDYVNVKDIASALLSAAEKDVSQEYLNLGTSSGHTVLEVIDAVSGFMQSVGKPLIAHEFGHRRKGDAPALVCNYDKAKELFGWMPTVSLGESIAQAWEVWK